MKIKTSILVALAILLFFQSTVVFASSEQVIEENKYKAIELNEEIKTDIELANKFEKVLIGNEIVTYYYGKGYTIVKDNKGYYKISFLDNDQILVNDEPIESRLVFEKNIQSYDYFNFNETRVSTNSVWKDVEPVYREYNVIGLAPSVIGGIIGGAVGMAIGGKIGAVFSVVGGAVVGTLAGGYFPEYYISIKKQVQYEYPIITQRPKMRTINYIYHGPKYDRYQNYWFSF